MPTRFQSPLIEKIPRVADIVSFRFERPDGYEYAAGQWASLTIPGPAEPLSHHFTMSSSPTEPFLEISTRLRGTEFKNALDAVHLGQEVEVEGPFGSFSLTDSRVVMDPKVPVPARPIAFITGGIGITAPRSILRYLADSVHGAGFAGEGAAPVGAPLRLLYANHSEDDIAFRDEVDEIARALPHFKVVHVLSRPSPAWTGRQGHVDGDLVNAELGRAGALTSWLYFLSGPPSLVAALRDVLLANGVGDGSIKAERYLGYE
jgi:ferredoxin-NADP reductase